MVNENLNGETALYAASFQGHANIVNYLIDSDANLEIKDNDGDTALHYSCFGFGTTFLSKYKCLNAFKWAMLFKKKKSTNDH